MAWTSTALDTGITDAFVSIQEPAIRKDSRGGLHAAYRTFDSPSTMKYAYWNGTSWDITVLPVSVFMGSADSVDIALDPNDKPRVVYFNDDANTVVTIEFDGAVWNPYTVATGYTPQGNNRLRIEIDSNGTSWILYSRLISDYPYNLKMAAGSAGTYTLIDLNSEVAPTMGTMCIAPNNTKYVAYRDLSGYLVVLSNSTDVNDPANWVEDYASDADFLIKAGQSISIQTDSTNAPAVVYRDNYEENLYYIRKSGSWGSPELIGDFMGGSGYAALSLEYDDDDVAKLSMSVDRNIIYVDRDGGSWQSAENVYTAFDFAVSCDSVAGPNVIIYYQYDDETLYYAYDTAMPTVAIDTWMSYESASNWLSCYVENQEVVRYKNDRVVAVLSKLDIGNTIEIEGVLDEDNMASDSAVELATQQSIKAYVDSQTLTIGDAIASGTATRILYEDGSNQLAESANLTFDGTGITTGSLSDGTMTITGGAAALLGYDLSGNTLTGTMAEFDTACSDGDFAYAGGAFHDGFSDFVANEHIDWTSATDNLDTSGYVRAAVLQHDAATYIDKDGSNNMIFVDAVTGSKTLAELAAGGGMTIGDAITGGTATRVLYEDGSNQLAESANFTFDGTNIVCAGYIRAAAIQHDAATYIDKDGSNNMTFTDAVTGTKTLAQLAAGGGGSLTIGDAIASGTANRVLYEDSSNQLAESANLTFNGTNLTVGGALTCSDPLTVAKNQNNTTDVLIQNTTSGSSARSMLQIQSSASSMYLITASAGYTAVAGWANKSIFGTQATSSGFIIYTGAGDIEFQIAGAGTTDVTFKTNGDVQLNGNSRALLWGASQQCSIEYDGTDMLFRNSGTVYRFDDVPVKIDANEIWDAGGAVALTFDGSQNTTAAGDFKIDTGHSLILDNNLGGRDVGISSAGAASTFAQAFFVPETGTNVGTSFTVTPKGTGSGVGGIQAQIVVYNTDFIADSSNWESFKIVTKTSEYAIDVLKLGTGSLRPFKFQMNSSDVIGYDTSGNFIVYSDQIQDSGGSDAITFDGSQNTTFAGEIKPASIADASASNNSIYYSTTQSKLVYKDSGGTVNNLY